MKKAIPLLVFVIVGQAFFPLTSRSAESQPGWASVLKEKKYEFLAHFKAETPASVVLVGRPTVISFPEGISPVSRNDVNERILKS